MTRAKVLIVEDELIIAKNIERYLLHLEYEVIGICASSDQVEMALHDDTPDIILMDIRLEGKEDGVSIAQRIHEESHIPVVYLTALMDETTLQRAKITEPFGYIVKPFTQRELHIGLEIALYKSQLEKKVREQELLLQTIIDKMPQGFGLLDDKLEIRYANEELSRILGVGSSKDAFGKNLDMYLWPQGILGTRMNEKNIEPFETFVHTAKSNLKVILTPQIYKQREDLPSSVFVSLTKLQGEAIG